MLHTDSFFSVQNLIWRLNIRKFADLALINAPPGVRHSAYFLAGGGFTRVSEKPVGCGVRFGPIKLQVLLTCIISSIKGSYFIEITTV